ncbi:hypothetical protein ACKLNR_002674 [Fusarium oxysporum f. sp. zingiberi]
MCLFPKELGIPGPLRVSRAAISGAGRIADLPFLGRLPLELVDMVQSHCPDAYFWNMRLQNHPHPPNHDPNVKFRRHVLTNEKDVKSADAYFQDGLCCLRAHAAHPGFPTWDFPSGSWLLSNTIN